MLSDGVIVSRLMFASSDAFDDARGDHGTDTLFRCI